VGVRRIAVIWAAALAAICTEPAAAVPYYGFFTSSVAEPDQQARAAAPSEPELFHTRGVAIPTNRFRDSWAGVVSSLPSRPARITDACDSRRTSCSVGAARWLSYLSTIRNRPKLEQIALVNRYVNWHISYADDGKTYGTRDYWANPLQAVGGSGDCEDYATAKYFSLILLGFSDDQLRLVIVRDTKVDALHALTTVWLDGTAYVLDNRLERVMRDSDLSMYQPVYSFNQHQNWMHVAHLADAGTTARQPQS
jgi:predicted transglutaminase-like cysteine proteinase